MNELAPILNAQLEGHPRFKLAQLEWEALPNEVRNLPRLPPRQRPTPPEPIRPMTAKDWEAWGL